MYVRMDKISPVDVFYRTSSLWGRCPKRKQKRRFATFCIALFCQPLFSLPTASDEGRDNAHGVLVHCLAGVSRSVTVTVAYLMYKSRLSLNDAYDHVRY